MKILHLLLGIPGTHYSAALTFLSTHQEWLKKHQKKVECCIFDPNLSPTDWMDQQDFDQVRCLMILQNPVEHCYQIWVEEVRKGVHAELESLEKSFLEYRYPQMVADRIAEWRHDPRVDFQLINQHTCGVDLPTYITNWLGMTEPELGMNAPAIFERSLTLSEISFLLSLRKANFDRFWEVSEFIMKTTNDFPTQEYVPKISIQEDMWIRNKTHVDKLNQWMPPGHQLIFDQKPHDTSILNNQVIDRSLFYRIHDLLMDELLRTTAQ